MAGREELKLQRQNKEINDEEDLADTNSIYTILDQGKQHTKIAIFDSFFFGQTRKELIV